MDGATIHGRQVASGLLQQPLEADTGFLVEMSARAQHTQEMELYELYPWQMQPVWWALVELCITYLVGIRNK